MREIRQSGSVRGVRRKPYPYRDPTIPVQSTVPFRWLPEDAGWKPQTQASRPEGRLAVGCNGGSLRLRRIGMARLVKQCAYARRWKLEANRFHVARRLRRCHDTGCRATRTLSFHGRDLESDL